jgi:glutathione S-transferase
MILIGQYDSPFVRRVGIALRHYGLPFEHRPWAVFRDAERIAAFNPLRKVPTLVLDDGTVLAESFVCLEWIDGRMAEQHGADSALLLLPRAGATRAAGLRVCGFALGVMEKAVSLVYERLLRDAPSKEWSARCEAQIRGGLALLERERAGQRSRHWLGERLSHADVAVTCATSFVEEAHPGLIAEGELPALRELARRCEATPAFGEIRQPFVVNR